MSERASICGLGKAAALLLAASRSRGDIEIVGGVDIDPAKVGRDLGTVLGSDELGVIVTDSLARELEREDVDVILHAAPGEPDDVAEVVEACLDAGKDVVTVNWFVHPATAYGDERAAALHARAQRGGARAVGTGVNPGLLLDVLPILWGSTFARIDRVDVRRVSDCATWGDAVLENEVGLGKPLEAVKVREGQLAQSCGVLAGGLRMEIDRWEETAEPVSVATDRSVGALVAPAGTTAGFRRHARGYRGDVCVAEVEWLALCGIEPELDEVESSFILRISGSGEQVEATLSGDLLRDPYPATAARMLNTIAVLRTLPPGLYRPDQLPLSPIP